MGPFLLGGPCHALSDLLLSWPVPAWLVPALACSCLACSCLNNSCLACSRCTLLLLDHFSYFPFSGPHEHFRIVANFTRIHQKSKQVGS